MWYTFIIKSFKPQIKLIHNFNIQLVHVNSLEYFYISMYESIYVYAIFNWDQNCE